MEYDLNDDLQEQVNIILKGIFEVLKIRIFEASYNDYTTDVKEVVV